MNPTATVVIFDMDGVLTDSEPLINAAAIAMFKEKGLEVQPSDFIPFVGTGEDRYIGGVAEKYHFPLELPAAKRRTYEVYLSLVPERLQSFAGAVELVRACRAAGLKVAVASSADSIKIEANLRKIGLPPEEWDAIVSGEEVPVKKPAPDIFLAAAAKLGRSPSECVVVEDAVNGIQAAKAARMRCVAVTHTFPAYQLAQADLICERISDLTIPTLLGTTLVNEPGATVPEPGAQAGSTELSPWGFWATLGLTAAMVAVAFVVQLAVGFLWAVANLAQGQRPSAHEAATNGLLLSLITIAETPVTIGLVCLFVWLRNRFPIREYLALHPVRLRQFLPWAIALLVLIAGTDWLTWALNRDIVPEFMDKVYRTAGLPSLLWFAVIVAAPLQEEVVFRGFIFRSLLHSRLGPIGAIVLTAATWASIHLQYNLFGIGIIFVSGLLIGYARFKTNSLYTCLYLHGLMNLIASLETAWF